MSTRADVAIEPWADGDLPLLHRLLGDPAMMAHLGGVETPAQIEARHARYLADEDGVYRIVDLATGDGVGWVGFWEHEWAGRPAYEVGWSVVPEEQGRGIAAAGTRLALTAAAARARHRWIHAFPAVDNVPSNAICAKLDFVLRGEIDFEYPKGSQMRCHDWCFDLAPGS